jgi:hypothetical protein
MTKGSRRTWHFNHSMLLYSRKTPRSYVANYLGHLRKHLPSICESNYRSTDRPMCFSCKSCKVLANPVEMRTSGPNILLEVLPQVVDSFRRYWDEAVETGVEIWVFESIDGNVTRWHCFISLAANMVIIPPVTKTLQLGLNKRWEYPVE